MAPSALRQRIRSNRVLERVEREPDRAILLIETGLAAANSRTAPETWVCWDAASAAYWYSGRTEQGRSAIKILLQIVDPAGEPFKSSVTAATGGGAYASLVARRVSNGNDYRARVRYAAGGSVIVYLSRTLTGTETALASVTVPTVESAVLSRADDLPFGLSNFGAIRTLIVVIGGFILTFLIVSLIYWAVPKGHMPWRSVWPGALFFSVVTAAGNYIFPLYLNNIPDLHRIGGTIGFILVALVWFYAISLVLLAGAVINSLCHETDDTGSLPLDG